jgi:hypothetical protein
MLRAHGTHEARSREAFSPRRTARREQSKREMQRRRQWRCFQAKAPMHLPVEWKARQGFTRSRMNGAHETQGLAIRTYEDV